MKQLIALYESCVALLGKLRWLPPLLARIVVGWVFLESGWGKIHNVEKVAEFFVTLNIPAPLFQAHLVAYTELVAGFLVLIGLATRAAAIPLAITMVVAIITAKAEEITMLSDLFAMSEFLYIVVFVWLIIEGAGVASVDAFLAKKLKSSP